MSRGDAGERFAHRGSVPRLAFPGAAELVGDAIDFGHGGMVMLAEPAWKTGGTPAERMGHEPAVVESLLQDVAEAMTGGLRDPGAAPRASGGVWPNGIPVV